MDAPLNSSQGIPLQDAIRILAARIVRDRFSYSITSLSAFARNSAIKGLQTISAEGLHKYTLVLSIVYPLHPVELITQELQRQIAYVATCLDTNWTDAAKARFGSSDSTYTIPI